VRPPSMVGMLFSIPVAKMKLAMEPSLGLHGKQG
jgi:hypothetical protein